MKRAAAIIGPTPSFIRWAIRYDCSFREIETDNLPYQTFRQLRGLREVSVGLAENRVIDGMCIHDTLNSDSETARGFPVAEVMQFFGSIDEVNQQCQNCPACSVQQNVDSAEPQNAWAGCYGWFRSQDSGFDLIELFQEPVLRSGFDTSSFGNANRAWYQVWQVERWESGLLHLLHEFLELLPSPVAIGQDFQDFRRAVASCRQDNLVLETELVPPGDSDGTNWTIATHCGTCRYEVSPDSRICLECGRTGHPVEAAPRKVLGLRPYMLLQHIVGIEKTAELLGKFRETRKNIKT